MNNFCFHSQKMREFTSERFKGIRAPFVAGIELTAKCNLRCVHCYAQNSRTHKDLTTQEIKDIIDILVDRDAIEIYFTGGEVFTRRDFEEVYIYAKRKGLIISVLSNITMLNKSHIRLFKEYPVALVSTSMYGFSEESYEKVTGVKGSFKKFINGIDLLYENNIPFEIKYIGLKQNITDVHKIRKFGNQYGVNMVFGFDVRPTSDFCDMPMSFRVTPREAFEFDINDDARRNFWIEVAKTDLTRETKMQGRKYGERYLENYLYPCQVAYQHVFITSDYKMQGCTKASYLQYDLKNGTFDEGWEFLNKNLVLAKAPHENKCRDCDKSLYCEACPANFQLTFGNTYSVDSFFCEVAALRKEFATKEAMKVLSDKEKSYG